MHTKYLTICRFIGPFYVWPCFDLQYGRMVKVTDKLWRLRVSGFAMNWLGWRLRLSTD